MATKNISKSPIKKIEAPKAPKAVIFYGPPGSGKGTQASFFSEFIGSNYKHFDTGSFIEKIINDPEELKKPIVKKQRNFFMNGKLCDPKWVISIIGDAVKDFSRDNHGLIFSGSPRTMDEAFGVAGKKGTVYLLKEHYGTENVVVFWFNIPLAESVKRNSLRGRPGLDDPSVIKVRCREYKAVTLPIVKRMKEEGITIIKIDAMRTPKQIAKEVVRQFKEFEKKAIGKNNKA